KSPICCRDIVLSLSARKRLDINMLFADKDKTMSLQQIEHAVRKSVLLDSNNNILQNHVWENAQRLGFL
ncbi:MAG: hypothetical protein IJ355_05965, partial [Prevotella sp.]|nr:hypothetical protein [Prevotella sp.]